MNGPDDVKREPEPGAMANGGGVATPTARTGPFSFLPFHKEKRIAPADAVKENAKEAIEQKRGRGRPRKDGKPSSGISPAPDAAQMADIERRAAELEKIFSPDNWRSIVRAPADLALALSGREYWDLPEKEVSALAVSASHTARYWMAIDPRYIVLVMFLFDMSVIYGGRTVRHIKDVRAEKKLALKKSDD